MCARMGEKGRYPECIKDQVAPGKLIIYPTDNQTDNGNDDTVNDFSFNEDIDMQLSQGDGNEQVVPEVIECYTYYIYTRKNSNQEPAARIMYR